MLALNHPAAVVVVAVVLVLANVPRISLVVVVVLVIVVVALVIVVAAACIIDPAGSVEFDYPVSLTPIVTAASGALSPPQQ